MHVLSIKSSNTQKDFDLENPIAKFKVCDIAFGAREDLYYAITNPEEVAMVAKNYQAAAGKDSAITDEMIQENFGKWGLWYNYYGNANRGGKPNIVCKICRLVERTEPRRSKTVEKIASGDIHPNI